MSIWTNINKRSEGNSSRKEEECLIYYYDPNDKQSAHIEKLFDGEGKYGVTYEILSNGRIPSIKLKIRRHLRRFDGCGHIEIPGKDGKLISFDRSVSRGYAYYEEIYTHFFNEEGDYVEQGGGSTGRKYTLDDLKELAEDYIDIILLNDQNLRFEYIRVDDGRFGSIFDLSEIH